jgi:hypothetical protein
MAHVSMRAFDMRIALSHQAIRRAAELWNSDSWGQRRLAMLFEDIVNT